MNKTRKIVTVFFIFAVIYMTSGLWIVKNYAADQATKHAVEVQRALVVAKEKVAYQTAVHAYYDGLKGCSRGNKIRVNLRNLTEIQIGFLKTARQARLAAVAATNDPVLKALNQKAADQYTKYISRENIIPQVLCTSVYTLPVDPNTPQGRP